VDLIEFPDDFPGGQYKIYITDTTNPNIAKPLGTIECEFFIGGNGVVEDKKKGKKK
jgi:hypothetical protein